nr:immunoglobulin light chain junction region [Macaca mulatta]
CQQGYSYPHSS